MANVLNKTTGRYLKSVHTPDYINDPDYIINPTAEDIANYKPVISQEQLAIAEKERLIREKQRAIAVEALKTDGVLDSKEELIK